MPLNITRRRDRGGELTIDGIVRLADGSKVRIRRRAQSDQLELAREEARLLEAQCLREAWHGPKERQGHTFAEAVISYLKSAQRAAGDVRRLDRILRALGDDIQLAKINQATLDTLRDKVLRPGAKPATFNRGIVIPVRAVMMHAARRGWCAPPLFESVRRTPGRTLFVTPRQAEALLAAAAPHLQPLLLFLLGTGARLSEAIELEWRDVDLVGARAIFWRTKNMRRRDVELPARVVAALAALPEREGPVFRYRGRPYADRGREEGGHIKRGWHSAVARGGLDPGLTPHCLRHSWASWHYAKHKDQLLLQRDGGWSSSDLVERYTHLLPAAAHAEIELFWRAELHDRDDERQAVAG